MHLDLTLEDLGLDGLPSVSQGPPFLKDRLVTSASQAIAEPLAQALEARLSGKDVSAVLDTLPATAEAAILAVLAESGLPRVAWANYRLDALALCQCVLQQFSTRLRSTERSAVRSRRR